MNDILHNAKLAWLWVVATVSSGLGTFLELIPNEIGKLATLVGIVLSLVLIYTHIRRARIEYRQGEIDYKKSLLETELIARRLEAYGEKGPRPEEDELLRRAGRGGSY